MSNFNTKEILEGIEYEEKCSNGFGSMIIKGIRFPENLDYDPMAKIWSSVRKRISEQYGVSVTGIFFYEPDMTLVSCNYCLNYAPVEKLEIEATEYQEKFLKTFQKQMTLFEDVITHFILNDNGYLLYLKCIEAVRDINEEDERKELFDMMFNDFLKSINIKTEEDDLRKAQQKRVLERALKSLKAR